MKPRRVVLSLEVETDVPLKVLRDSVEYAPVTMWRHKTRIHVLQAQANVVEPWDVKEGKRAPVR